MDLLLEASNWSYSCLMANITSNRVKDLRDRIPLEDYKFPNSPSKGFQDNLHVTIHYGIFPDISFEKIKPVIKNQEAFNVLVTHMDFFDAPDTDILILKVRSFTLNDLQRKIIKFPCKIDFPDYTPHITLAYLKKGLAKKWIKPINPFNCFVKQLEYSYVYHKLLGNSEEELEKEKYYYNLAYETRRT
jgi:2'-5' RNA ligase